MSEIQKYDVLVLGSGPGGYVAAARAAQLGMKTAVVEKEDLGGVCLNWGCIPTKALLESAHVWKLVNEADRFGITCTSLQMEFRDIINRSRDIAGRMSKGVGYLLKNRNVTVIYGTGSISRNTHGNPGLDIVTETETIHLEAEHLVLATGGKPTPLPGVGFDGIKILHSKHAMSLEQLPGSLIIIGAGAIGMEFASFFRMMGSDVTIVEMMPRVLPLEDEDIVRELNRNLRRQKISVMAGTQVTQIDSASGDGVMVYAEGPKGSLKLSAEKLLVAIGVSPNSENLDNTGIEMYRGFVKADAFGRTNVPGIYAVGDVTGPPLLAHKASAEALACVDAIAGLNPRPVTYEHIPGCTYCIPQVASVGLTEKKSPGQGTRCENGDISFPG